MSADPLADRHTTHVTPLRYGTFLHGNRYQSCSRSDCSRTVSYKRVNGLIFGFSKHALGTQRLKVLMVDGLKRKSFTHLGSCPDWNPVATLSFECGVSGTGLLTTNVNNAASEVEMRYKLVATDFDGNTTVVMIGKLFQLVKTGL